MRTGRIAAWVRQWGLLLLAAALLLAGCGGGGGDDPAPPPLQGNWELTLNMGGGSGGAGTVPGNAVPTQAKAASIDPATVAQQFAAAAWPAPHFTVSVSGSTITVTAPGTDYRMTVNSISVTQYQGCGACGVGTQVRYVAGIDTSHAGTFEGREVPLGRPPAIVITFVYERTE